MATYAQTILADAPIGYWRLNETSGTVAADSSGHGNPGTYTGTFALGATSPITSDSAARALNLTGASSSAEGYVTIPDVAVLDPTTSALSIECWVKAKTAGTATAAYAGFVYKQTTGSANWGLNHEGTGTYPGFSVQTANSGASSVASSTDDTGAWIHVVGVYSGSTCQVYLNGATSGAATTASGAVLSTSGTPLWIGNINTSGSYQWSGYIAEVAVYATALSPSRISAHYAAATAVTVVTEANQTYANWTNPFVASFAKPLPATTTPIANSANVVAQLATQLSNAATAQNATYTSWALNDYPIFVIPGNQAMVSVYNNGGTLGNNAGGTVGTIGPTAPIPPAAQNAVSNAIDSPLIVFQPSTDTVWEFWEASYKSGSWSAGNAGMIQGCSTSNGIFPSYGCLSATRISYLATLITENDIASGSINHTIPIQLYDEALNTSGHGAFVPPAVSGDTNPIVTSPPANSPTAGMWFQMPASVAMPSGLTPFEQMVFKALQTYGGIALDNAGVPSLGIEQPADWATNGNTGTDPLTTSLSGNATYNALPGIPWGSLQVIAPPPLGSGTPAYSEIQSSSALLTTSGASATVTLPNPATAGNLLLGSVRAYETGAAITAPAGFAQLGTTVVGNSTGGDVAFFAKIASGGETAFNWSATSANTMYSLFYVTEFSGNPPVVAVDGVVAGTSSTTAATSVSLTYGSVPAAAGELVVAMVSTNAGSAFGASGWTLDAGGYNVGLLHETTTASAPSGTFAWTGSSAYTAAMVVITAGAAVAPAFTAAVAPPSHIGAYHYAFGASGQPAPTFSVSSGTLPPGLALSSTGVVSGTPTTTGTYRFAVTATNAAGTAVSATQTVVVAGPQNRVNWAKRFALDVRTTGIAGDDG